MTTLVVHDVELHGRRVDVRCADGLVVAIEPVSGPVDGHDTSVQATGGTALTAAEFPPGLTRGPVKILLDDHDLPAIDDLVDQYATAHRHDRSVAVHCVTRTSLVLALAAWDAAGPRTGDRIEHGSIVPAERPLADRCDHGKGCRPRH